MDVVGHRPGVYMACKDSQLTRKPLFQIPLIRELILVLLIKLALIVVIRWLFFSDPVTLNNPHTDIARQLGVCSSDEQCTSTSSSSNTYSVTNASQQEDHHDQ